MKRAVVAIAHDFRVRFARSSILRTSFGNHYSGSRHCPKVVGYRTTQFADAILRVVFTATIGLIVQEADVRHGVMNATSYCRSGYLILERVKAVKVGIFVLNGAQNVLLLELAKF
jgi:hypothetical protein